MKALFILVLLLITLVSTKTFATNTTPKQEVKRTQKSKYDFNIFKFYSIVVAKQLPDSLKTNIIAQPFYRKED